MKQTSWFWQRRESGVGGSEVAPLADLDRLMTVITTAKPKAPLVTPTAIGTNIPSGNDGKASQNQKFTKFSRPEVA